jgi:hypothetical protein
LERESRVDDEVM